MLHRGTQGHMGVNKVTGLHKATKGLHKATQGYMRLQK